MGMTTTAITTKWVFPTADMHLLKKVNSLIAKEMGHAVSYPEVESLGHCPLAARCYLWNYKMWISREITTATSYARNGERHELLDPGAVFPYSQQLRGKV
jgi:hypothetical protein